MWRPSAGVRRQTAEPAPPRREDGRTHSGRAVFEVTTEKEEQQEEGVQCAHPKHGVRAVRSKGRLHGAWGQVQSEWAQALGDVWAPLTYLHITTCKLICLARKIHIFIAFQTGLFFLWQSVACTLIAWVMSRTFGNGLRYG